jgi:CDP-diacylglycerol---serine O-phosphatidyltransferase
VGGWLVLVAFLMISSAATPSWQSLRIRRRVRLELIALVGLGFGALLLEPWATLVALCVVYVLALPIGVVAYGRIRRQRAARLARQTGPASAATGPDPQSAGDKS